MLGDAGCSIPLACPGLGSNSGTTFAASTRPRSINLELESSKPQIGNYTESDHSLSSPMPEALNIKTLVTRKTKFKTPKPQPSRNVASTEPGFTRYSRKQLRLSHFSEFGYAGRLNYVTRCIVIYHILFDPTPQTSSSKLKQGEDSSPNPQNPTPKTLLPYSTYLEPPNNPKPPPKMLLPSSLLAHELRPCRVELPAVYLELLWELLLDLLVCMESVQVFVGSLVLTNKP